MQEMELGKNVEGRDVVRVGSEKLHMVQKRGEEESDVQCRENESDIDFVLC